jgi:uncharacterized protein
MKGLIETIVKAIVDDPKGVVITEIDGQRTSLIELKVNKDDIGKVIGKGGRIAKSIRTILTAASAKMGKRYSLEIIQPE